jgi:serine phosphatase RsbU (regulator of sigma subunit)
MPKKIVVFWVIAIFSHLVFSNLLRAQNINQETLAIIEDYKKQADDYKQQNNTIQQAGFLNKIAYLYWENGDHNNAIQYFSQSLTLNKQNNNLNGVKSILFNIGLIYSDIEDYKKAYDNFHEGLSYARKLNQKDGIYQGLINEASALKKLGKHNEAIKDLNEGLLIAQELNNIKLVRTCYGMLAENYEAIGNSEKTMEYYNLFASVDKHIKSEQIKDIETKSKEEVQKATQAKTLSDQQLTEKVVELEETQESLKKTEEITKQQQLELEFKELAIREKEAQLKNERIIRFSFTAFAVLILLFLLVLIRQIQAKKKANSELAAKNVQIQEQSNEIKAQRDLANKQKQNITDSIEYGKRIQQALLPPAGFLRRSLPEHFILFKPRDIVSGDFYWLMNKDSKIIIAAADCTGHGVPGAFMSMLGTAFLNEIVNKIVENKHVYSLQANEILNQLRTYVIESLHQTGRSDEAKDGIDLALCIIDYDTRQVQFSGARNPLYHISTGELKIYKGDPMPASIHQNADIPFTNHEISVKEGDIIYMFTDGYPDQIGGPQKRKFMSRSFQELLLKIHQKPMDAQHQILDKTIEEWRGTGIQIDDILVVGLKLEFDKVVKSSSAQKYHWSEKTILIADDTDINYIFLVEALKNTGVQTLRAKNGQEAVDIIKSKAPVDLILMDINMPLLNGFEATTIIKSINKNVPVIAQTALNIEDAKEKATKAGCDDYILKPIRLKLFLSMLESYLNKSE